MAVDIQQLATELSTDPLAIGYAEPLSRGANQELADLLNEVRASIQIDVAFRESWELQNACVASELAALTDKALKMWEIIINAGRVEVRNNNMRGQIIAIWAAGTTTRSNLAALQTRDGSRAEALWGDGGNVTLQNVRDAVGLIG